MALNRCEAYEMLAAETGARNSLFSYFIMMNRSLSSWLELGPGLRPVAVGKRASQTELATRLPSAVMTER